MSKTLGSMRALKALSATMVATGAMALAGAASAAITAITAIYTSDGLRGVVETETFETLPLSTNVVFLGGRRLASGTQGNGAGDDWGYTHFAGGSTIVFKTPVRSFGLFFGNDDPSYNGLWASPALTANIDIYSNTGLQGTISRLSNYNDRADQYLGANTSFDVRRITFRWTDPPRQGTPNASVSPATYFNDLSFGNGVVPEPTTWAMMILGFGCVGAATRQRRRRSQIA